MLPAINRQSKHCYHHFIPLSVINLICLNTLYLNLSVIRGHNQSFVCTAMYVYTGLVLPGIRVLQKLVRAGSSLYLPSSALRNSLCNSSFSVITEHSRKTTMPCHLLWKLILRHHFLISLLSYSEHGMRGPRPPFRHHGPHPFPPFGPGGPHGPRMPPGGPMPRPPGPMMMGPPGPHPRGPHGPMMRGHMPGRMVPQALWVCHQGTCDQGCPQGSLMGPICGGTEAGEGDLENIRCIGKWARRVQRQRKAQLLKKQSKFHS